MGLYEEGLKTMNERIEKIEELLKERANTISLVKMFLSHISTPVAMLDKELNLLLWSRRFAQEFFKENLSEYQGQPLSKVAPSVYEALENKHMLHLSLDGQTFEGYFGINGHKRFFTYTIAPWVQEGFVEGVIVSFINITSEKLLHDRLKIYESRLNLLSSLSNEGIILIDDDDNIAGVNSVVCNTLKYKKEDIVNKKIWELAANPIWEMESKNHVEKRKAGVSEVFDFVYKCGDGSTKMCEVRTSPLMSDNDIYIGAVSIINAKEIE